MRAHFPWLGNIENRIPSRVTWNLVCLPKVEGGLGLSKLSIWNNVLCLRFIWLLLSGANSLWAACQKHQKLCGISCWAVEPKKDSSSLKSIRSLKLLAEHIMRCKAHDLTNHKFLVIFLDTLFGS